MSNTPPSYPMMLSTKLLVPLESAMSLPGINRGQVTITLRQQLGGSSKKGPGEDREFQPAMRDPGSIPQIGTPTEGSREAIGAVAPASVPDTPPTMSPEVATRVQGAIATVASKLTRALAPDDGSSVFSAPGVTALMMFAANGTEPGAERDAFLSALGLGGLSMDEVNNAAAALTHKLANLGKGISVNIANLAVTNSAKSGGFLPSFTEGAARGAQTAVIDDDVQSTAQVEELTHRINAWVKDNTNGMIPKLMDASKVGDMVWYLLSAIAFDGKWTNPFTDAEELLADPKFAAKLDPNSEDEESFNFRSNVAGYLGMNPWDLNRMSVDEIRTQIEEVHEASSVFTMADGTKSEQNMMKLTKGGLRFVDSDRYEAVMLPYGEDAEGAYMVAMLPKNGTSPKDLLVAVGSDAFNAQVSGVTKRAYDAEDQVFMPRFKTSFEPASDAVLTAFNDIAPLSFKALTERGMTVPNDAVLKAVIEVGPRSTKAAQVAGFGGLESMRLPPTPRTIKFDRPFAYAIITPDDSTPIFQGVFDGSEE